MFKNTCKGAKKHRHTNEIFIEDCKKVYGNTYKYSKVKYVNCITPVIITCEIHGDFKIIPNGFIHNKAGCPKCYKLQEEKRYKDKSYTSLKEKLNLVGLELLKFEYKQKSKSIVEIKCKKHNFVFNSDVRKLKYYNYQGCFKCREEAKIIKLRNIDVY